MLEPLEPSRCPLTPNSKDSVPSFTAYTSNSSIPPPEFSRSPELRASNLRRTWPIQFTSNAADCQASSMVVVTYSTNNSGAEFDSPLYDSAVRSPEPVILKAKALPEDHPPRPTTSWTKAARSGVA